MEIQRWGLLLECNLISNNDLLYFFYSLGSEHLDFKSCSCFISRYLFGFLIQITWRLFHKTIWFKDTSNWNCIFRRKYKYRVHIRNKFCLFLLDIYIRFIFSRSCPCIRKVIRCFKKVFLFNSIRPVSYTHLTLPTTPYV